MMPALFTQMLTETEMSEIILIIMNIFCHHDYVPGANSAAIIAPRCLMRVLNAAVDGKAGGE
jgi:formate-dependent nitrite reductase cytochrome c552 subunit